MDTQQLDPSSCALRDKPANKRARAWADEFGMAEANRSVTSGDRNLFNYIFSYVQFLYEKTEEEINPTNASKDERLKAVEYVRRSFSALSSVDSTIESLMNARKNEYVRRHWPHELLPLERIKLPGRQV